MRVLLINPNMTRSMTDAMSNIARETAGDNVEIVAITADRGFPYIASRTEALIAGGIVLELIAENVSGFDAVIIAAFGDPGLVAARELFDVPIVGMAEAAFMSAAMLGETFAVVTFSPAMSRWYTDCVTATGLGSRFLGVLTPDSHRTDVFDTPDSILQEMKFFADEAALQRGADVIIMGGAPLAGLAPKIAGDVRAILIDPIATATVQAIALCNISRNSNFSQRQSKPLGKQSKGLTPSLSAVIKREDI